MRFPQTEEDARVINRRYLRDNREAWKRLGFRMMTASVHDDDREVTLAYIDTLKFQRMANMAEDADTEIDQLRLIGMRNMSKRPSELDRNKLTAAATNSEAKDDILYNLEKCRHYLRKYTGVVNKYDPEAEYTSRSRMEAKAVAYNNTAVAYYKLALKLYENSASLSVFNNPQVEDSNV